MLFSDWLLYNAVAENDPYAIWDNPNPYKCMGNY